MRFQWSFETHLDADVPGTRPSMMVVERQVGTIQRESRGSVSAAKDGADRTFVRCKVRRGFAFFSPMP